MTRSHKKITNPKDRKDRRYVFLFSDETRRQAQNEIRATLNQKPFAVGYCACGCRLSVADTGGVCLSCSDEREMLEKDSEK